MIVLLELVIVALLLCVAALTIGLMIMADKTATEVLDAIAKENAGIDSLVALVSTLKAQVGAAVDSGASKAEVDAIFDAVTVSAAKVQDALGAAPTA